MFDEDDWIGPFNCTGISTYVWNKLFKREILLEAQILVDNRISMGEEVKKIQEVISYA